MLHRDQGGLLPFSSAQSAGVTTSRGAVLINGADDSSSYVEHDVRTEPASVTLFAVWEPTLLGPEGPNVSYDAL